MLDLLGGARRKGVRVGGATGGFVPAARRNPLQDLTRKIQQWLVDDPVELETSVKEPRSAPVAQERQLAIE